jgi:hypothetical protein
VSGSTAQHSTAQHSTAQHRTAQQSTAQHSTAQHSTAQHSTAQHSTAQHSTAQHSTAHVGQGVGVLHRHLSTHDTSLPVLQASSGHWQTLKGHAGESGAPKLFPRHRNDPRRRHPRRCGAVVTGRFAAVTKKHTHRRTHIHTYTHTHIRIHTRIRAYTHTQIHTQVDGDSARGTEQATCD